MALTRPTAAQIDSTAEVITDPISLLNNKSNIANVDVGFLLNRDGGISSNVAMFWQESSRQFVFALTSSNAVGRFSNIAVTSNANVLIGNLTISGQLNANVIRGNTGFQLGPDNTMGTVKWDKTTTPSNPWFGIYDTGNGRYYGIATNLPAPPGVAALGGYYRGMGVGGTTSSDNLPIFGVLNSTQGGETGCFVVYDTKRVKTFTNTLDDGSGNMILASNTVSTSTSTGALTVTGLGGVGIAGNLFAGQINTPGNVVAAQFVGSGSLLTALPGYAYSNVNVAAYTQTQSYTNYSNVNLSAYLGGAVTIGGNLTINGNLFVNGNVTTINANNLNINDSMIYLADDNPADTLDIGIVSAFTSAVRYQHTGFVRDATDGTWKLFAHVVPEPTTTVDFTNATYSNLLIGNLTLSGTTTATSNVTGAVVINGSGGLGVGGNIYVGQRVGFVWGTNNVSSVYQVFNYSTNSLDTVFG